MAIVKSLYCLDFINEFNNSAFKDKFSPLNLRALYNYLMDLSQDIDMKFDIIDICCAYNELEWGDLFKKYNDRFNEYGKLKNFCYGDLVEYFLKKQDNIIVINVDFNGNVLYKHI